MEACYFEKSFAYIILNRLFPIELNKKQQTLQIVYRKEIQFLGNYATYFSDDDRNG